MDLEDDKKSNTKKQNTMRLIKVIDDVVQYTDEACRADADQ